jgi:deazaflavin-dependent oxidoreductase (nitroreductase family)
MVLPNFPYRLEQTMTHVSTFGPELQNALARDRVIDITTTGRKSGRQSRIETWFYRVGDRFYLTGTPGKRDWYANLRANPAFTFHLKRSAKADLPARATPITDEASRREILASVLGIIGRPASDLDAWVAGAPLMEVTFEAI